MLLFSKERLFIFLPDMESSNKEKHLLEGLKYEYPVQNLGLINFSNFFAMLYKVNY